MKQPTAVHSFLAFTIMLIVYFLIAGLLSFLPDKPTTRFLANFVVQVGVILVPILIYAHLKGFNIKKTFYLNLPSARIFFISLLVIISGLIIIAEIHYLLSPLFKGYEAPMKEMAQEIYSLAQYDIYLLYLLTTLTPAICEEVLFRGFILRGFRNTIGKTRAIIASALLFGIMHLILPRIVITTLLGILFGLLLILTNSILIPIVAHLINNVIVVFIMLNTQVTSPGAEGGRGFPLIPLIALFLFILGLYLLVKNKPAEPDSPNP